MPLMRRWSQALANISRRYSLISVLEARTARPFGLFASSSSRSVVRMPMALSDLISSTSCPSMLVSGYDIDFSSTPPTVRLNPQASDELAESGDRADDFADCFLPELLSCVVY